MKEIRVYEDIIRGDIEFKEAKANLTMFWAYRKSQHNDNELLDFNEVIWEEDIPEIVEACREYGIERFTISSNFSGLLETLAAFTAAGFELGQLTTTKAPYRDFQTGEWKVIPAITVIVR